jgi:putative methyltransferase
MMHFARDGEVPLNVLISEPQSGDTGLPFVPMMWGILKTYWEHHGSARDAVEWLTPIYRLQPARTLVRPYADRHIDVLGLSCYSWNFPLQCAIARLVKEANPRCLVVAGGPEPDSRDQDFFEKYPYIDVIVVKDGEIPFTRILSRLLEQGGDAELHDIPGLYLPAAGGAPASTGAAEVPAVFQHSHYLEQSAHYEPLIKLSPFGMLAVWETNRGCPFSCSFCDWGSNTMSKVRQFDLDRLYAEIEWFGRMRISTVMIADANFGMLPRDLDIAECLIAAKRKYRCPVFVTYNTAKNHPARTVAIARRLVTSGLTAAHILSIQHTDEAVLGAVHRQNISVAKQVHAVRELMAEGIPVYAQLILGMPGDTYDRWKRCFTDLMEWGVHSYHWVFPFDLLPNAPAAEPEYRREWEIETAPRYVALGNGARIRGPFDAVLEPPSRLVFQTRTFTRADWVRMATYTACEKALHNCCATDSIAIYLRFTHDVSYARFYDAVVEDFFESDELAAGWRQAVHAHYEWYRDTPDAVDFMDLPQFPDFQYQLEPSRWIFTQLCLDADRFYARLKAFLLVRFPAAASLDSAVDFQKNILVRADYDRAQGKTFRMKHDWPRYFAETTRRMTYSPMPEPDPLPAAWAAVTDQAWSDENAVVALDWAECAANIRPLRWLQTVVIGRNSKRKNNFQSLHLVDSPPGVAASRLAVTELSQ